MVPIPFDFDEAKISEQGKLALAKNARCLNRRPGQIRIEGHCDGRGTTEYNLALGERRANAVKRWLKNAGVLANRIMVLSLGKERPVCMKQSEACWKQNRRVEIRFR